MLDDMHSPRTLVTVSSEDTSSTLVARVRRVKPPSRVTVCHERVREACARSSESDAEPGHELYYTQTHSRVSLMLSLVTNSTIHRHIVE